MRKVLLLFVVITLLMSGCSRKMYIENYDETVISSESVVGQKEKLENETKWDEISITEDAKPSEEKIELVEGNYSIKDKVIVVDAGHGINSYNKQETIAPNSAETKNAFASGTSGKNQTEEQLNLAVAIKLKEALEKEGAIVHMTRTTHESDMTNIDRAIFANDRNAHLSIKIHADGNNDSSVRGVSVLIPGARHIRNGDIISKSKTAGEFILQMFVAETGAINRGVVARDDLTGFNWTTVPIVLIEMGFMTNPEEDRLMETDEYQIKMVNGIVKGVEKYFQMNI